MPSPELAAQFGLLFDDYGLDALFCEAQGRLHARYAAAYDCNSLHYSLMSYIVSVGQQLTTADVFNFYMDIRMFGPGYEEMYREAQQKYNIHFIRGRISEASPMIDGRVQIKAEDTLTGRPLRMSVDMLILIVGMRANDDNAAFAEGAGLNRAPSGFMAPRDMFLGNVKSNVEGIFYAGTVTAPKNIGESLNEGTAAADAAARYVGV